MNETMTKLVVSTLVALLASTVKNPQSEKARRLRAYVEQAHEATGQFLLLVPVADEGGGNARIRQPDHRGV